MLKKKICWVTPDWFVDVDMPIVPHLLEKYDITWIIFFPWRHNRFKEADFKHIMDEHPDLKVCFIHCKLYGLNRLYGVYACLLQRAVVEDVGVAERSAYDRDAVSE